MVQEFRTPVKSVNFCTKFANFNSKQLYEVFYKNRINLATSFLAGQDFIFTWQIFV